MEIRVRRSSQKFGLDGYEPLQPFVAGRTIDRSIWYEGQLLVFYADGEAVGNSCAVWEGNLLEGMGPPPHIHLYEHEMFFILSGSITAWIEGERHEVSEGSLIFMPAGRAHWFVSSAPNSRMLSWTVSAHADRPAKHLQKKLFEYMGVPAQEMCLPEGSGPDFRPDPDVLAAIAEENGSHVFDLHQEGWRRAFGERGQIDPEA